MSLNFETLFLLIKQPKLLLSYLLREKSLSKFLGIGKAEVKMYLREAQNFTNQMLKLATNPELGTMLSPLRGPIVYVCIRTFKPLSMVETGVASGSSTFYILQAMELNRKGILYSIDFSGINPGAIVPKGKETGWLVPPEVKHRWKLIVGKSQERLLPLLKTLNSFDAFLHDSEHTYETMMFEYEVAWGYLREGGLLLSDDVNWNMAFDVFLKNRNPKRWAVFGGLGAAIK